MTTVTKKALVGAAWLLLVMALMLFGSAGSIRFWQGWIYWSVFSISVVVITIYFLRHDPNLVARRTSAGPIAEPEPIQKVIQAIASVFFCALLIVPGLDHRFHWSSVRFPLVLAGNTLVAISFAIIFIVFKENSFASSVVQVEKEQPVISTGLYAYVRHPMYAGGGLLLIATPLALGSWWGIPVGLVLCAVIVVRLFDEERRLAAELSGYEEYRRKVPYRIVPGIW
jgi:protein-S-isoprenylcysteine O-methyltransferase Ste14